MQIGEEKPSLAAYDHLFADLSISRAVYTLASSSPLLFRLKSVELGFAQVHRCSAVTCSTIVIWQIWRGIAISQLQQWRLDFCIFPIWAVYTFASFFFFCSHEKGLTLTLHFAFRHVGSEMKEGAPNKTWDCAYVTLFVAAPRGTNLRVEKKSTFKLKGTKVLV